jgi:hypothetical protein
MRAVRRLLATLATLTVATVGLIGLTQAPAVAAPTGFTVLAIGDGSCKLASIDVGTGVTTPIAASGSATACVNDLALAPDGTLYGLEQSGPDVVLVRFDVSTGAATVVGPITTFNAFLPGTFPVALGGGLAFDAAGTMYVQLVTSDPQCTGADFYCLYKGSPSNPGAVQFVGTSQQFEVVVGSLTATCSGTLFASLPFGLELSASAFSPRANSSAPPSFADLQHQLSTQQASFAELAGVSPTTGKVTTIGPYGPNTFMSGLEIDQATGTLWGLGVQEGDPAFSTFTIDPVTGAATKHVLISQGETVAIGLAITGTCPAPPVTVQPRFTG